MFEVFFMAVFSGLGAEVLSSGCRLNVDFASIKKH